MDWLKKNQKQILAVLGVLLMVGFLVNVPMSQFTKGAGGRGVVVGHFGKTAVYSQDQKILDAEWKALTRSGGFRGEEFHSALEVLGRPLANEINQHTELFLMLVHEAESRGINISRDSDLVNSTIKNQIHPVEGGNPDDPLFKDAIRHLLMVAALKDQFVANFKTSHPKTEHDWIERSREAELEFVTFTVGELSASVPAPTTQQVKDQYEKYKDVAPDKTKPDDVLGFAYQKPNQVKLQYVTIPNDELERAVRDAHRDSQDKPGAVPYYWERRAWTMYLENPKKYVRPVVDHPTDLTPPPFKFHPAATQHAEPNSTKPARHPATSPAGGRAAISPGARTTRSESASTQSSTSAAEEAPLAASRPASHPTTTVAATLPSTTQAAVATTEPVETTKPFAEVEDEILRELMKPEMDALRDKVARAIITQLATDSENGHKNIMAVGPTTRPATPPAIASVPATQPAFVASYEYLVGLKSKIERDFKIQVEIHQIQEWMDEQGLENQPGIGSAFADHIGTLPHYATHQTAPFISDAKQKAAAVQILQPSPMFSDSRGNGYVFRLTEALPDAPALEEIAARVTDDAITQAAYDKAQKQANALKEAAKTESFFRAALDMHKSPTSTGSFNPMQIMQNPHPEMSGFRTTPDVVKGLAGKAKELLDEATTAHPNPIAIYEVPTQRRVIVAELADARENSPRVPEMERYFALQTEYQAAENAAATYFSYDAVKQRVNYKPEKSKDQTGEE